MPWKVIHNPVEDYTSKNVGAAQTGFEGYFDFQKQSCVGRKGGARVSNYQNTLMETQNSKRTNKTGFGE